VRVIGTRFQVVKASRREGTEVEVAVKRGVVEVRRSDRDGEVRKLAAGETWSVWIPAEPASTLPKTASTRSEPAGSVVEAVGGKVTSQSAAVGEQPAPQPSAESPPAAPSGPTPAVHDGSSPSAAKSESDGTAPALRGGAVNVRGLFLRANIARRAGKTQEAASAYAELLKRFPRDSRAGVSAFELGRIRMDALGDAKGAAQAFTEALQLSRKAQFREDALARLAIASDASGDADGCRTARMRYLTDYPSGVHIGSLTSLCGSH
jgi:TolA-binding protein